MALDQQRKIKIPKTLESEEVLNGIRSSGLPTVLFCIERRSRVCTQPTTPPRDDDIQEASLDA